ncbi:MAG: hypothetical protein QOJ45_2220 [Verrucomicrobiota bacterium]|jgi:hypothetical protein
MTPRYIVTALFFTCGFASPVLAESLPENCVILSESEGHNLVSQCSRAGPDGVTAFWTPSVAQVLDVEKRLPALLKTSGHKVHLADSGRQYIGVTSRGRRLIYINAFQESMAVALETNWRKKAFTICDGGDAFWGVAFDPNTGHFLYLGFNGIP